jgi:hypothetical protein
MEFLPQLHYYVYYVLIGVAYAKGSFQKLSDERRAKATSPA